MRVYPPVERPPLKAWVGVGGSPRVGGPRGALRLPADARHHRRRPAPLRALRRALPPGPRPARPGGRCRSASTRRGTSPTRTRRRARSSGRTTRSCGTGSAPSAAGPRPAGPSSSARSPRARSTSARRRPSPARSPRPCGPSARPASISSTARARCRTSAMLRSIELYGREVIPRVRRLLAEAPAVLAEA